jgi:hypothetical protein
MRIIAESLISSEIIVQFSVHMLAVVALINPLFRIVVLVIPYRFFNILVIIRWLFENILVII